MSVGTGCKVPPMAKLSEKVNQQYLFKLWVSLRVDVRYVVPKFQTNTDLASLVIAQ